MNQTCIQSTPDPLPPARPSFPQVYENTAPLVFRALRRLGVPATSVEDAVQEVFLVVHRRLHEFEGRSSVRTWVYGIAVRVARTHRRTLARRPTDGCLALDAVPTDPRRAPDALVETAEAQRIALAAIEALDDDLREVFVLSELEGMTAVQIGHALSIGPNTASSRLRLARRDVQRALDRHRARDEWKLRSLLVSLWKSSTTLLAWKASLVAIAVASALAAPTPPTALSLAPPPPPVHVVVASPAPLPVASPATPSPAPPPSSPPVVERATSWTRDLARLREAQRALANGDAVSARAITRTMAANSPFEEERNALVTIAACRMGSDDAASLARAFRAARHDAVLARRVDDACGAEER